MEIEKLVIKESNNKSKRLKALIYVKGYKKPLIRRFGSPNAYTFFDGANDEKRIAYINRHKKLNENWEDITTAGALSYHVLWQFKNIQQIEKFINRKFKIPIVNISITKNKEK